MSSRIRRKKNARPLAPRRKRVIEQFSVGMMAALGLTVVGCGDDAISSTTPPFECMSPTARVVDGVDTGFVSCDGYSHRPSAATCPSLTPRNNMLTCTGGGDCTTDADCTANPNGFCQMLAPGDYCSCAYGCTADADCAEGQICSCGDPVGQCVAAECTTDADCPGDLMCTSYDKDPSCGPIAFACQTADDECASNADCAEGSCTLEGDRRVCVSAVCAIGRPFLVEGAERMAPAVPRAEWCLADVSPETSNLSPTLRGRLSDHWTVVGLMEHASVAAFARFALQLLQLGAPPELIVETNAAMVDETEHARLCFALASAYAGQPIGPGRLDMEGAFEQLEMVEILEMVIEEGCIGETVAAVEAAESAELTSDPAVRTILEQIAADESRHAQLAWRTLRWALETGDSGVRDALNEAFENTLRAQRAVPTNQPRRDDERILLAHGVFSERLRSVLRRDVVDEVIEPMFRALMADVPHRTSIG